METVKWLVAGIAIVCSTVFLCVFFIAANNQGMNKTRIEGCASIQNEVTRSTCINGHLP